MTAGRPLTYTDEIGVEICQVVSTSSDGLNKLCAEREHWPIPNTIYEWRIKIKEFGDMYARAKQSQVEVLVEEIIEISDDKTNDTMYIYDDSGEMKEICNKEWIARSRLRIDSRKWLASKLAPRIYGDKIQNETTLVVKQEDAIKELA
jgi:hypothetical protein